MVEMLIAFAVFSIIVSFIPMFYRLVLSSHSMEVRIQRMEWEVFISQLRKELQSCDNISGGTDKLVLVNNGEKILIEKYGTNLRRRVNNEGHELMLQKVKSVHFTYLNNGIAITVLDTYQTIHMATIYTIINREIAYDT